MKRLIVGAALLALAGGASAEGWQSSGGYAWLESKEFSSAALGVDKENVAFMIRNMKSCSGGGGSLANPSPGRDLNVNGQPLKTIVFCRGGDLIIWPQTQKGIDFISNIIESGKDFSVIFAPDAVLHFENSKGRKNLYNATQAPEAI